MFLTSAPFWVWLLFPAVITLVVMAWVTLARRNPRDWDDAAMVEYQRFSAAMARARERSNQEARATDSS
ncbi:MAG: hypothetical protein ACRCTR_01130 [Actinomycetota bacterium]